MRRVSAKHLVLYFFFIAVLFHVRTAGAHEHDLTIARFIECTADGSDCRAHNDAYERFMAEYAFGVAPKLLSPASTLGYSGFYLGVEASIITVPDTGDDVFNAGAKNYEDARWRIGTGQYNGKPPAMLFPTVHVRKGLPWSLEVGSSISYLAQSELVALGGEVKWAPFEGYRKGFRGVMPDVAVKGAVNRIIGQTDVDMTIIGIDGSISYPFGVGGMISLEPYAGYSHIWTIIRTEPMIIRTIESGDGTPGSDIGFHESLPDSFDVSEAGLSGPNLSRHKIFFGLNFRYELLSITMDWAWGLPREWTQKQWIDDNGDLLPDGSDPNTVTVEVDTQFVFSMGTALQF